MEVPQDQFVRLLGIVQRLRAPDGCPWDREQTPVTLRGSVVEEAWECVSAIDAGDDENLAEELGDLYLMATMVAWMKEQEGAFSVTAVLTGICEKLIRRHPHVFGTSEASTSKEVLQQWAAIKAQEKASAKAPGANAAPEEDSSLAGIAGSLPPLERAYELQKKAARVGFDWPDAEPVWTKLEEEIAELRDAQRVGRAGAVEAEIGDLLFTVVNLSRALGVDPAVALHGANTKFVRRFQEIESRLHAQGLSPSEAGLQRMDSIWEQVKLEEARDQRPASAEEPRTSK